MPRNPTWEDRLKAREEGGRTYYHVSGFLRDMRQDNLREGFVLAEYVFLEIATQMAIDKTLAIEIANNAVLLLLNAEEGKEVDGLVHLAQTLANE